MKNDEKHMIDIDLMLRQTSVNDYEPSSGFVDKVMNELAVEIIVRPQNKYIRLSFQLAAACAIIIFITNIFVILSSTNNNTTNDNDWSAEFQTGNTTNWYDYYADDVFLANNQNN